MKLHSLIAPWLIATALVGPARAHGASDVSEASALSMLPVAAVSATAGVVLLSGGMLLTVGAVHASGQGAVWVLERSSDGARFSVEVARGASVAVGSAVVVTALASGYVLSSAGRALCIVPNAAGRRLLHDERVWR